MFSERRSNSRFVVRRVSVGLVVDTVGGCARTSQQGQE